MADHTLGTIRGTIEIDYDGAGIVKAIRDTDKAKSAFGSVDSASTSVLKGFTKFAGGAAAVSGAVNLVGNSLGAVAGLLAIVGPLAAAGFAAAPGVVLAYVSALAIAKIAVSGVGEALGAAGEDAKKFEESIEGLSPQAQAFAKAFRAAYPALQAVRTQIQDAFFKGTAGQVAGVVQRIASLTGIASQVASRMSAIVQNVVRFVTSGQGISNIRTILSGVNDFLGRIQGSVGPVVAAFIGLAAQMGQFGSTLGGSLNGALARFTAFLNGINIQELFAKALPIVQQLASFFGDVAAIAGRLFSIFSTDGANAAGILAELAAQLRAFLDSAAGQAALEALGQAIQAISTAGGQIFLALLQALAPALVALAPAITILAGQISSVLVTAINALNPLLTQLATFLSENMSWLGPLAGVVVAAAAAYRVYAATMAVVTAAKAALNSQLAINTLAWIRNAAAVVATRAGMLAAATVVGVQMVGAFIASTAAIVANRVAMVAAAVAAGVVRAAMIAWTAIQWALNAALSANPIGLVVLAIAALVAAIIYAWNNSETFRTVVLAVWGAIKTYVTAVVKGLVNAIKVAWNTMKSVITTVGNAIKSAWTATVNAIKNVATTVWNAIVSVITGAINRAKAVINGIKTVIAVIRTAFSQARAAALAQLNNLISIVRSLPGRVVSALGGLGSLLYNKGKDIIRGFINGIGSMIGAVKDKVNSVVSAVTDFLPGSPAKTGPLSGKGYVLLRARRFMNDFARGLDEGGRGRRSPLQTLLRRGIRPIDAALPGAPRPGMAIGAPVKVGGVKQEANAGVTGWRGNNTYNIGIGGKPFAELVVDALTGEPIAVQKAASEGSRRTAWAGSGR